MYNRETRTSIERRVASERRSSGAGLDCRPASPRDTLDTFPGRSRRRETAARIIGTRPNAKRRSRTRNRTSGENNPGIARSGVTSAPLNDRIVTEDTRIMGSGGPPWRQKRGETRPAPSAQATSTSTAGHAPSRPWRRPPSAAADERVSCDRRSRIQILFPYNFPIINSRERRCGSEGAIGENPKV